MRPLLLPSSFRSLEKEGAEGWQDEEMETVSMNGKLVVSWNDSALAWDRQDWDGLSWLNFYWNSVWTPSLVSLPRLPLPDRNLGSPSNWRCKRMR